MLEARAALEKMTATHAETEEQLRVANEKAVTRHMEVEAADETIKRLQQQRQEDLSKLQHAGSERVLLAQQVKGLEERLASAAAAADKQTDEFHRQRRSATAAPPRLP